MVADIAIVGGGPAGLALAGTLERAGISFVVYERSALDTPPRGGCLDLHPSSGQLAMKEAGCYDKFRDFGRAGDATIHQVWDSQGNKAFQWGEGEDQPELDRAQIKEALLSTFPPERIEWKKALAAAERDASGKIVLTFEDGTTASGFKLVVGADGSHSRVRHLVTPATPRYSGYTIWTGEINKSNPFHATVESMAKLGPMVIMGRSTMIWNQRQGDGRYRLDIGFQRPEHYAEMAGVDLADPAAVKQHLLADELYGGHASSLKDLIRAIDTPFHAWPLTYMPPDCFGWDAAPDVTLVGDAAHVTTPFIGEGVNIALQDSVLLTRALREHGMTKRAVQAYEKDMFARAKDVITKSVAAGRVYYDWNAPAVISEAGLH